MLHSEEELLHVQPGNSRLWKFICQQKEVVEEGTRWHVRDGNAVSFFNDTWLFENQKISDLCLRTLTQEERSSTVHSGWIMGDGTSSA